MKISVIGAGYVGLTTAACLAQIGHDIFCSESDLEKLTKLQNGVMPLFEPHLEDVIKAGRKAGRLRFGSTEDAIAWGNAIFICVGTPPLANGDADLSAIEGVARAIAKQASGYRLVIEKSTVPVQTGAQLQKHLSVHSRNGLRYDVASNPEFLREGSAVKDYFDPPFVLVGADRREDGVAVLDLYSTINADKHLTDPRTAALVKYACNAFHAVKVSFANEIGSLSKAFGADGHKVMELVREDRKLNISQAYLRPGFAFGGSCLPKDLRAITRYAEQYALRLNLLASVLPSNESHLRRAMKLIRDLGRRRVGLVGLSFKAGTDDLRESPMVDLAEAIIGWGYDVKIYDPNVMLTRLRGRNLAYIDQHLPHLANLLVPKPAMLFSHAEILVLCTNVADDEDWVGQFHGPVLDLRTDLARS